MKNSLQIINNETPRDFKIKISHSKESKKKIEKIFQILPDFKPILDRNGSLEKKNIMDENKKSSKFIIKNNEYQIPHQPQAFYSKRRNTFVQNTEYSIGKFETCRKLNYEKKSKKFNFPNENLFLKSKNEHKNLAQHKKSKSVHSIDFLGLPRLTKILDTNVYFKNKDEFF